MSESAVVLEVGGMSRRLTDRDGTVTRWYTREQLERGTELPSQHVARALWDLARAEARGFTGCQAVFVNARYDGLDEAMSPESRQNGGGWGRGQDVTYHSVVRDGKVVRDDTYPSPPPEWRGEYSGLACEVRPNFQGARCGYVTVPQGHAAHGKSYNDLDISVHGGLTYARAEKMGGGWTFGFDCSHYGDAGHPEYEHGNLYRGLSSEGEYRSLDYALDEVASLARQLATITPEVSP